MSRISVVSRKKLLSVRISYGRDLSLFSSTGAEELLSAPATFVYLQDFFSFFMGKSECKNNSLGNSFELKKQNSHTHQPKPEEKLTIATDSPVFTIEFDSI